MGFISFVKSMFTMLRTNNGILTRIEFLVITSGLLYLCMFFLDLRRHRSHSSTIKYILVVLNGVADSMLLYILGIMQSTPFENELFLIWAVMLVNLRYSANYISAHGLPDQAGKRLIEFSLLYACVWTANLNASRATRFKHPLWLLWALQVLMIVYRLCAYELASRSLWHGLNSLLLTESIKLEQYTTKQNKIEAQNPSNLSDNKETHDGQDMQKWQEPNENEEIKLEQVDVMPQEQAKPQQEDVAPRKQTKTQHSDVVPQEQINPKQVNVVPSEQIKPQQVDDVPSEQIKTQHVSVVPPKQTEIQQVKVVPRKQTEIQQVDDLPQKQSEIQQVDRKQTETRQVNVVLQSPEQAKVKPKEVDGTSQEQTENQQANVSTNSKYKYFVRGETKQKIKVGSPDYLFCLKITQGNKLITLDKILECHKQLLGSSGFPSYDLTCLCLSFALYRLLRCRFDDLPIPEETIRHTQELIFKDIMGDKNDQNFINKLHCESENDGIFQIIEAELAFINDYYYTRTPLVFWKGFPFIKAALMICTVSAIIWLGLDMRSLYEPLKTQYTHVVGQFNVDLVLTWVFMFLIVLKEFWEMATYIFSDWNKVLLVCKYVEGPCWFRSASMSNLARFICNHRVVKRWHGEINMYNIMESFSYNPWKWNILYWGTLGLVSKRAKGEKPSTSIKLSKEVKKAVAKSLLSLRLDQKQKIMDGKTKTVKSRLFETMSDLLPDMVLGEQFKFSWSNNMLTYSHFILIWHIATCICEIKLSKAHNTEKPKSILLGYAEYALSFLNCCSSPKPFLIKLESLEDDIRTHYAVANSISRYCTYLLISQPELVPDQFFMPQLISEKTISHISEALQGCVSLEEMYDQLINTAKKGKYATGAESMTIVQMGAELGCRLVEMKDLDLWNVLAEFWADLLVYMAPNWNVAAHKKCLESGGEFVTQIWAILSHAGIVETTELPKPKPNSA